MKTIKINVSDKFYENLLFACEELGKTDLNNYIRFMIYEHWYKKTIDKEELLYIREKCKQQLLTTDN